MPAEIALARLADGDILDARAARSAPADFDHFVDDFALPRDNSLDAAVGPVTHPPFEPASFGFVRNKGAEADALYPSRNSQPEDFACHLFDRDIVDEPRRTEPRRGKQADRAFIAIGDARQSLGMPRFDIVNFETGARHRFVRRFHYIGNVLAGFYPRRRVAQRLIKRRGAGAFVGREIDVAR